MNTRERIVIYSVLAVVLAINAVVLTGHSGTPAFAEPLQNRLAELGPASKLILENADGKQIALHMEDGRLAWSEQPHDRTYSAAFVNIGKILRQLMQSEVYQEERQELMAELDEQEQDYRERLREIQSDAQDLDQESEEFQQAYERYMQLAEEYRAWQQEAIQRRGDLDAEHLERAYRELVVAVQVVADRKDIDIVYRFIPTDQEFESENPDQAMTEIRLRSALRYPDQLDMTDAVIEEMSLELDP
jgi:Skp family chaperone for outer membrane proteins